MESDILLSYPAGGLGDFKLSGAEVLVYTRIYNLSQYIKRPDGTPMRFCDTSIRRLAAELGLSFDVVSRAKLKLTRKGLLCSGKLDSKALRRTNIYIPAHSLTELALSLSKIGCSESQIAQFVDKMKALQQKARGKQRNFIESRVKNLGKTLTPHVKQGPFQLNNDGELESKNSPYMASSKSAIDDKEKFAINGEKALAINGENRSPSMENSGYHSEQIDLPYMANRLAINDKSISHVEHENSPYMTNLPIKIYKYIYKKNSQAKNFYSNEKIFAFKDGTQTSLENPPAPFKFEARPLVTMTELYKQVYLPRRFFKLYSFGLQNDLGYRIETYLEHELLDDYYQHSMVPIISLLARIIPRKAVKIVQEEGYRPDQVIDICADMLQGIADKYRSTYGSNLDDDLDLLNSLQWDEVFHQIELFGKPGGLDYVKDFLHGRLDDTHPKPLQETLDERGITL